MLYYDYSRVISGNGDHQAVGKSEIAVMVR